MKQYTVAILGATGAVGTQMLECLNEQEFPVGKLKLLASARSAGKTVEFRGEQIVIEEACPEAFEGCDIVLGAAGDDIAKELLPEAVKRGAVVVDNSHAFRMDPEVPLVVPEINADDIKWHHGLIANPNCATIIGLVPTWPLHQLAGVKRMIVSTYQAASGAGAPGMAELEAQLAALGRGEEIPEPRAFAAQLASNLIPQIGGVKEEGFTSEEMKLQNEGRKIMHLPELRVNCTCVRVPVLRSHSESITLEFERDIAVEEARAALAAAPGVKLVDDMSAEDAHDRFPMPMDTSDQDLIWVGRVRRDISNPEAARGITFWCCGDQIRKGAASSVLERSWAWLNAYFAGQGPRFKPPLHMIGTAFQREVWYELLSIPRGEVATYGEIALRVAARHRVPGNEDPVVSPRAVGAAVARNPISIIVPCHRVVAADGSLNGYAGGLDRKEWLLRLEGAYEE